jgi:hypothetical protein
VQHIYNIKKEPLLPMVVFGDGSNEVPSVATVEIKVAQAKLHGTKVIE